MGRPRSAYQGSLAEDSNQRPWEARANAWSIDHLRITLINTRTKRKVWECVYFIRPQLKTYNKWKEEESAEVPTGLVKCGPQFIAEQKNKLGMCSKYSRLYTHMWSHDSTQGYKRIVGKVKARNKLIDPYKSKNDNTRRYRAYSEDYFQSSCEITPELFTTVSSDFTECHYYKTTALYSSALMIIVTERRRWKSLHRVLSDNIVIYLFLHPVLYFNLYKGLFNCSSVLFVRAFIM